MTAINLSPNRGGKIHIAGVNYDSLVDGEGVRTAIYLSGCEHNCAGCHNREAQSPEFGSEITSELLDEIADAINARQYLSGITLTGGDPLYEPDRTLNFLLSLMAKISVPVNVWLYTGAVWEDICDLPIMDYVDVVIDGPFVRELADKRLTFRGSRNQRIIDVKESKKCGSIELWKGEKI